MAINTSFGEPRIETVNVRVFALNKEIALKEMKKSWPEAVISDL